MSQIHSRAERVILAAIVIFLFLPLPLTILSHTSMFSKAFRFGHLLGMQTEEKYTPFSFPTLLNAKYQESLGRFFDKEFVSRVQLIKFTNELYFRMFKVSPMVSAAITVGRHDTLYGTQFLDEYYLRRRTREELEPMVRDLKTMQDACRKLGMGYVVLVTPSKASIESELNPRGWDRFYNPSPRGYDLLIPLLKQYGLHYVDGHAILAKAKGQAVVPLFPKGGIHWGQYGGWLTANALVAELQSQGQPLQFIERGESKITNNPTPDEADDLLLMNLVFPWKFPVEHFDIKPAKTAGEKGRRPNLVFVSGSFMWRLADILSTSRQFSEIDCYYYYKINKTCFVDGKINAATNDVKPLDFAREIFAADNLVLELNEERIPAYPTHLTAFLDDALKHLPDESKPREPFLSGATGGGKSATAPHD